jgi:hypothetical protein
MPRTRNLRRALEAMATEAGVPREAVKKARSWADVAALITAAGQPGDEEEEEVEDEDEGTEGTEEGSSDDSDEEEEDEWDGPVVGDMYSYRIGKKLADVEVLEVNASTADSDGQELQRSQRDSDQGSEVGAANP